MILKKGLLLKSTAGNKYFVDEFLGSGGQGEVYSVSGNIYALKWYYPNIATERQLKIIKRLILVGPPNDKFLWPIELIIDPRIKGFGYIMKLRKSKFKSVSLLMSRKIEPSFYNLIKAALQMVDSFEKLHLKGLCYRDISFGNLFIDAKNGEILICDNDNIVLESEVDRSILGTPRFMAPEIVRGSNLPNVESDLFSLSVLLFYMLFMHHPLEGKNEYKIKCFDLPAMNRLYGENPIFIFDPNNSSNRPVKGIHDNAIIYWNLYPKFLKSAFIHAFTKGLKANRGYRLKEKDWKRILLRLKNSLYKCKCGAENFYDFNASSPQMCWNCKREIKRPKVLYFGSSFVILNKNTEIFQHNIDESLKVDFNKVVAKVVPNPDNREILGLKNLSNNIWKVKSNDNKILSIKNGWTVNIETVSEIAFDAETIAKIKV